MRIFYLRWQCFPHRLYTKTPTDSRSFSFNCWSGLSKKPPKHYRLLLLPFVVSKSLWVKSLQMKTLMYFGHRILEDLSWIWTESLLPNNLAVMVPASAMQTSKGGKQPIVLASYDVYEIQWPPRYDIPNYANKFICVYVCMYYVYMYVCTQRHTP